MAIFSRKPKAPAPAQPQRETRPISTHAMSGASVADEVRIHQLGSDLLAKARAHKAGILSSQFYSDALMNWSMKDPNFKVQLFRFVDCFPMLRTPEDVFDHLQDYLSQPDVTVPAPIAAALKLGTVAKGMAAGQISKQITGMAQKFIAGEDAASALGNLKDLWSDGIAFSVDLLGEACVSDVEADAYQVKYLDLIRNLPSSVSSWKANPRLESDHLGAIPRTNVSIKISSLSARCDPIDTEGSIRELMRRIVPILEEARDRGVFVNFDMEQFAFKDLTIELFQRCVEKVGAAQGPAATKRADGKSGLHAGIAIQAYLITGDDDARKLSDWAKRTGNIVTVRLVKGAYWDYHVIHSEQMGWPCPVWPTKPETDASFERMTSIFLDAAPRSSQEGGIKLALGSHNARSIAAALAGLEQRGLPQNAIELQMLHGMADQLKYAASEMGLRIREYVPVGDMIPGMAYLVRRLLENTSNESWLKAGFLDNADVGKLLASPHAAVSVQNGLSNGTHSAAPAAMSSPAERHQLSPAVAGVGDARPFYTEPARDFSQDSQRRSFAEAVSKCKVPQVQNNTTPAQAAEMVAKAEHAFLGQNGRNGWRDVDPRVRADVLIRAAKAMRERRDELSGVMIKEAGKTWREADADTCEAIDFCEYYARLAVPMFTRSRLGRFLGELDEVWYQPRGVSVVIAPWNFPLAICTGMTVAALVTGNTVIVKPAEQTPGIAKLMHDILRKALHEALGAADVPDAVHKHADDILHFCPAPGETTGAALVRDPRTALVAFTGSRDVGLDILTAAAPGSPFQSPNLRSALASPHAHVKRVVCEMGGKNALIIDTSADLDEAVLAARQSAFGFQGQKCSACSRLIVVDAAGPGGPAFKHVVSRLVEATKALVIGDPALSGTDVGPVIDAEAGQKIRGYIQRAKAAGLECHELSIPTDNPFISANTTRIVSPTIFVNVPPAHELATDEIFGPVLAVIHAKSYDEALEIANNSPYKLTGGVFSRKPSNLETAKRSFRVGNLYLNRGITGALVARQPFGGFGMSGVGSKAGGADYLLQFVEPRASCENTMRRGFAPEL